MNQQKGYVFALALALCLPLLISQPNSSLAAGSSKTTNSFSYSSKVVGNTVIISGNSTTSSKSVSAPKTAVSKTPASSKAPSVSTSKTTSTINSGSKAPTSQKISNGASSQKTVTKAPVSKPKAPILPTPTKTISYFIPAKKPATALVFKPAPKVAPKILTKIIAKSTPKIVTPPKKVVIKLPASVASKSSTATGRAVFTPETITAAAFPPAVAVSEPVFLSAPASSHYRVGTILGQVAQVRFTPIESAWNFGDGTTSTAANPAHSFAAAGTYSATVAVKYSVSYRLAGQTNWITEATPITLTDQVQIVVAALGGQTAPAPGLAISQRPYLVGDNCLKNSNAFAC